jgi:hypothetical protein
VRQLAEISQMWRYDLKARTLMLRSGDWVQAVLALVAPFGWAWLLFGAQPAAASARASFRRH